MRSQQLGVTGITVTEVCLGTSPLGGMQRAYGHDVSAADAVATVVAAFESPIRFLDTSNEYGDGASEERIGRAIAQGTMPDDFVIATKADPVSSSGFSAERVLESFEESMERLGLSFVPLFYLHDPERFDFEDIAGSGGALEGMRTIKDSGRAAAIGVAGGVVDEMRRYVDTGVFDVVLNHNRYTLLNRTADTLINHSLDAGLAFVNAAPYASGMLAKPQEQNPRYAYREPAAEVIALTAQLRALCLEYNIDLAALALQFSTRDPRISSTVVGASSSERVRELTVNVQAEVPDELWARAEELVRDHG